MCTHYFQYNFILYVAMASLCDSNLRKTVRYGGRKNPPAEGELEAIIVRLFCDCYCVMILYTFNRLADL